MRCVNAGPTPSSRDWRKSEQRQDTEVNSGRVLRINMKRLEKKHPLAIRWFHWINFPVLMIMIWSGLLIYWANDVYRVGYGSHTLVKFFPDWFYDRLNLKQRLAEGMAWHFMFMWFFAINGLLYVIY